MKKYHVSSAIALFFGSIYIWLIILPRPKPPTTLTEKDMIGSNQDFLLKYKQMLD